MLKEYAEASSNGEARHGLRRPKIASIGVYAY